MVSPRASDIAHRGLAICNPLAPATLERVTTSLALEPGATAFDLGCGKGDLLFRLASRYAVKALGIDLSQSRIEEATAESRRRGLDATVLFECRDARTFEAVTPFTLTACIGSTHALGALLPTLQHVQRWTLPGGTILIGEGFWARDPDPAYLEAIGAEPGELGPPGWVEDAARALGLEPLEQWIATRGEWDAYEGALLRNIEEYVAGHPGDPEGPSMLADQRAFHGAQVRWGRETMGFGVYLLRNGP